MSASVLFDAPGPKARRRSRIISVVGGLAIAGGLLALVWTLANERTTAAGAVVPGLFDPTRWDIFLNPLVWERLGQGVVATLQMAAVAAVFAIAIGILFSFGRAAESTWIRVPVTVILEFFRGMPVLLMMLFVLLVFSVDAYWAGVAALAVYNGAIIGEALRAGIQSLPRGQREAGLSVGMTPLATRFRIEFPQAFRQMLPIIVAQLVVLLKDTSLAFIVGYNELLRIGVVQISNAPGVGPRYFFSLFFVVLVIYLAMNLALSWVARYIARRSGPRVGAATGLGGGGAPVSQLGAEGTTAITLPLRSNFDGPDERQGQ